MGRPMKEGLDYFPHDTDAANDEKIEAIKALFGAEGYAFYFISLERIYRTKNGQLEIGSRERRASLTAKIGVDDARFMEMLSAAFEVGLFDRKAFDAKGLLTSKGIKRRVRQVNDERERKRQWRARKTPAEKSTGCDGVLDVDNSGQSAQRKEKKSKEKQSNSIPPKSPKGEECSAAFLTFWEAYPRKVAKKTALSSFGKINPDDELLAVMLAALSRQTKAEGWTKDRMQYIPHPTTWLNQRRWEDETGEAAEEGNEYAKYI